MILDEEALKILSRSISTKHCIQLWGQVRIFLKCYKSHWNQLYKFWHLKESNQIDYLSACTGCVSALLRPLYFFQGESYDAFHTSLKSFPHMNHPKLTDKTTSFKINVETFMKKTSVKERIQLIETMDYLPIQE